MQVQVRVGKQLLLFPGETTHGGTPPRSPDQPQKSPVRGPSCRKTRRSANRVSRLAHSHRIHAGVRAVALPMGCASGPAREHSTGASPGRQTLWPSLHPQYTNAPAQSPRQCYRLADGDDFIRLWACSPSCASRGLLWPRSGWARRFFSRSSPGRLFFRRRWPRFCPGRTRARRRKC